MPHTTLFAELSPEREQEFRAWARDNWGTRYKEINPTWHPVVRDEIKKMIDEDMDAHQEYICILEIGVTARNPQQAAEYAQDDVRDAQLGHWNWRVYTYDEWDGILDSGEIVEVGL